MLGTNESGKALRDSAFAELPAVSPAEEFFEFVLGGGKECYIFNKK
jgi:hypothetical protein